MERTALANVPYELDIGGKIFKGSTDGSGNLQVTIPADAHTGRLTAQGATWSLNIGALNPVVEQTSDDGVSGAQGRLTNLGYYTGPISGVLDEATADALRSFQTDQQLEPTGTLDEETHSNLAKIHGL